MNREMTMDKKTPSTKDLNTDINTKAETPWYKNGLCFSCQKCGSCCSKQAGYVWVTEEEIETIAAFLKISKNEFCKKYIRICYGNISLKECFPSYDCIFLLDGRCRIYEVRPKQCKTFPWWKENLSSKEEWDNLQNSCPGINKGQNRTPASVIEENLKEP
jgi:hypothetical protein